MKAKLGSVLIFVWIFSLVSCDKVEFPNVPSTELNQDCDTIFSFSSSTSNTRNILVEDFTGHLCGYCPAASYEIDQLHSTYGDQIIGLALHANTSFNTPQVGSGKYETDWRIEETEQIFDAFDIPASLPRIMINREYSTAPFYFFNVAQMNTEIVNRIGQLADFSIKTKGSMLADRTICAQVEIELLNTVSGDYGLVTCLVEDSIIDYQTVYPGQHPDYVGAVDDTYPNYIHKHVLRDIIGHYGVNEGGSALTGSIWGDEISGALTVGEIKQFIVSSTPLDSEWDETHMYIVTYIFDDFTKEVVQVTKSKITP